MALEAPSNRTETGKKMGDETHNPSPLLTDGQAQDRLPPGADMYMLSEEEKAAYGIKPNEVYSWIRNPKIWANAEKQDRAREFIREGKGNRIPLIKGEPVMMHDLILACRPAEEVERARAQEQAEYEAYVRAQNGDTHEGIPNLRHGTPAQLQERMLENRREAQAARMLGPNSPTAGLTYEMAERVMEGKRRRLGITLEEEQAAWRSGGRVMGGGVGPPRGEMEESRGKMSFMTGNNPIGPRTREERAAKVREERAKR